MNVARARDVANLDVARERHEWLILFSDLPPRQSAQAAQRKEDPYPERCTHM